ncbi:hypothetical protein HAX54_014986, partial [Datura stramonium]|nr:hypothetical protein [Datura stramonium]
GHTSATVDLLQWTRYSDHRVAAAIPTVTPLFCHALTATPVSLQWESHRCSGPSDQ